MKILHTADLHLGQVIYQNYDRCDEHHHFFKQLKKWCKEKKPDALLISGDIFDIQQPSASIKKTFTEYFVDLHKECPDMAMVITAGNHDSASRLQADHDVWNLANTTLIGIGPTSESGGNWADNYIVRLKSGYVVAIPFMTGERPQVLQEILNKINEENADGKPVVMMGHTAVAGLDATGHDFEIGKIKTQDSKSFGEGFDYLALGHIHKPQTIGHQGDTFKTSVSYPAPVVRYSGSALHVSCDEDYPHTVSLVEIDKHGGTVKIEQLRIDELRHFYILPEDGSSFTSSDEAINAIGHFCQDYKSGYIRLRIDNKTDIPSNFNQMVYDCLALTNDEVRYNPKILWTGQTTNTDSEQKDIKFEIADIQQMTNPLDFIEKTIEQYPTLTIEEIREAFNEVEKEIKRLDEEEKIKIASKTSKKTNANETTITL
jgi:exonuclease SbcD